MVFISFIGIDGSGKTTIATSVTNKLIQSSINVRYVWSRYEPWIAKPFFILAKLMFLRKKNMYKNYPEYSQTRRRLFRNSLLSSIYLLFVIPDAVLQNIVKIAVPLLLRTNLIVDRYIFDTVIDIACDKRYSNERTIGLLKSIFHLLPTPDVVFLLDISTETAFERKRDIPSPEYLEERRKFYLAISQEFKEIRIIDASLDIAEIECEVFRILKDRRLFYSD